MSRQLLRAIMTLGVILTLVGGTGVFAVFTDRATTDNNDATSGELGHAADLQIATTLLSPENAIICEAFVENLTTGLFSLASLQPSNDSWREIICLRNVGSASLDLTMSAVDLVDYDIDCTGDEAAFLDLTCGPAGGVPQLGELSGLLLVSSIALDCSTNSYLHSSSAYLGDLTSNPMSLSDPTILPPAVPPPLAPGATACFALTFQYPSATAADDVQRAQSDQVVWRFAFDGTVPST